MRSSVWNEQRGICTGAIALLVITAFTFSPVLYNGFTGWDDAVYVTENPLVRSLSWSGIAKVYSTFVSGNYHPLAVLFQAVEYRIFGSVPGPYHGASLLLHLVNVLLVFRLIMLLAVRCPTVVATPGGKGDQRPAVAALTGALLFAVHPMRVESVAWVSDQKDLLASVFALGALVVYAGSSGMKGTRRKIVIFLLFFLAMLSKATVLVLPLLLLLIDHFRGALNRCAWRDKMPLFCASAVFGVAAIAARASYQPVLQEYPLGLGITISMGLYRLLCYYFVRTVMPFTKAFPLYPAPASATNAGIPGDTVLIAGFVVLCGLIALSLRRTRTILFGTLFFLIALLPSLTVEALGFAADRFSYLPAVGLCFIAGVGFQKAWSLRAGSPIIAPVLLSAAVGLGCTLAVASFRQSHVWRTSVTLWTYALEVYPATPGNEFNRAHAFYYRGLAWQKEGALERALADFDAAVNLMPKRGDFLTARGVIHDVRSETVAALADFTRAIDTGSGGVIPLVERGIIRTRIGAFGDAAADFNRALKIDPANVAARFNLGIVYMESGKHGAALQEFSRLLGREHGNAAALYGRAMALSALGDQRRAGEDLARAEALGYPVVPAFREQVRRQAESQR